MTSRTDEQGRANSQDPVETAVQLGVDLLKVIERDLLAEQLLVEGQCEAAVQVVTVEDRQADHAAHEMEVRQMLLNKTCSMK